MNGVKINSCNWTVSSYNMVFEFFDKERSMHTIKARDLSVQFDNEFTLQNIDWTIEPEQHWVITGSNGAGKSALAASLCGYGDITSGKLTGLPNKMAIVSFEAQAELIAAELKKDDADIMDVVAEGTPVREILAGSKETNPQLVETLIGEFKLNYLLDRAFRKLSTGESRKVMLVRALASEPELLVLDEPFDGLDADTLAMLQSYLEKIKEHIQIIMVLNRFDEFPAFTSHVAYVDQGQLIHKVSTQDKQAYSDLYQLMHLKTTELTIPPASTASLLETLDESHALVDLKNIQVKYADATILDGINWRIERQEHWQLSGPNGSGKTALLSLITGDHPQCYVNDIFVFGYQRGNGESIWQIKQYIGYVSTALQWEYRVGTSLRNVIISGFYDSIGLYNKSTDVEKEIANQWLALLGMANKADQPFNQLSYGDQRLILIARAMVKHPPLLILDEPCLGLDDINRQLVLALIEKICAGSETTVIYVNHHAEDKIQGIDNHLKLDKTQS